MQPSDVQDLGIASMSRIKTAQKGVVDEAVIMFRSIPDRDYIQPKAPALAKLRGIAGMKLEIPDHIYSVFKLLEKESYNISKRNPGAKRNIRFDDSNRSFFMDVKIEGGQWERIFPAQVLKAQDARKDEGPSKGVSDILGVGPDVLLDGNQA